MLPFIYLQYLVWDRDTGREAGLHPSVWQESMHTLTYFHVQLNIPSLFTGMFLGVLVETREPGWSPFRHRLRCWRSDTPIKPLNHHTTLYVYIQVNIQFVFILERYTKLINIFAIFDCSVFVIIIINIHCMAKSMYTPDCYTHMWFFPKWLPQSWKHAIV